MGTAPAFATAGEAIEAARAALGYLAAADAVALPAESQAECLRGLERTEAVLTAARASMLAKMSSTPLSPLPWLNRRRSARKSLRAFWVSVRSQPRKLSAGS